MMGLFYKSTRIKRFIGAVCKVGFSTNIIFYERKEIHNEI